MLLIGIFYPGNNDEETLAKPVEKEVVEEELEAEEEIGEEVEPTLTDEEVDFIAENLEGIMEEGEAVILQEKVYDTHNFKLEKIEFDADANQLNFIVDYQAKEPDEKMLSADVLILLNQMWAWTVAENLPGMVGQEFDIRVIAWSTLEDTDDVLHWGTTRYRGNEYTFSEGAHFDMLE